MEDYTNDQFCEMRAIGYTVKESLEALEKDPNVDKDVLKQLIQKSMKG